MEQKVRIDSMRPLNNVPFCPIATEYENDNPQNSNVFRRFYFHIPCTKTKLNIIQRFQYRYSKVFSRALFTLKNRDQHQQSA